ncbi:hypothetical protein ALI22I_28460 [Saccharothrix sp. ALI-22-I]|uniref:recombinase family protein n=1 Tax=Saccharothrix sp. ALI-22-I TaxID=1933778 RepID=UPI00097BECED|nr:recombinase family protein [Saccharothrix sp. ALI-22-I]ONI85697.1 hypothetical protein ALI22I_28460 [Saccharothrix sp. ALI-22-I]
MTTSGNTRDAHQVVWGYLHTEQADEIEIAALRHEIAAFCRRRGLKLAGVRIDRRLPTDQIVRPGFSALLEVLELRESYGVVVPHLDRLSEEVNARALLTQRIKHTATELIVIDDELPTPDADTWAKGRHG